MVKVFKRNAGFTLIEVVTVVVVMSIVSVFTFSFLINSVKTYQMAKYSQALHGEAAYILERITRELRDSQNASWDASTLALTLSHKTPQDTSPGTSITYTLSGSQLNRISNSISRVMGKNIASFSGSCAGNCCTVALTTNDMPSQSIPAQSYGTKVCLKNQAALYQGYYYDVIQ